MANRPAPALVLREGDREELARITRSTSVRAGLAQRARIVLAAADGEAEEGLAESDDAETRNLPEPPDFVGTPDDAAGRIEEPDGRPVVGAPEFSDGAGTQTGPARAEAVDLDG